MILFLALSTHQGGGTAGDSSTPVEARRPEGGFRLTGPMEAGRLGGAFGPKLALFPGAVVDLRDEGTNACALLRRPFDERTF